MKCASAMRFCLVVACAVVVEASILKETKPVSFDKNFPVDTRPKAAASSDKVLKFNHPYPVVQDSEDFDKDFVKDENTDNGEFKAQSEYDLLRHKLVGLKDKAAKQLAKKNAEKKDIEVATEKAEKEHAKDKLAIAEASKTITPFVTPEGAPVKPVEPVAVKPTLRPSKVAVEKKEVKEEKKVVVKPVVKEEKKEPEGWSWWPFSSGTTEAPEPEKPATTTVAPEPVSPTVAAKEAVEKAKDCIAKNEKELAAAKAELKTLTDELEKAKKAQEAAKAKAEKTEKTSKEADAREELTHKKFDAENKEYLAQAEIYEKQLRKVEAMRLELKIASQKVAAMRDAEDKNGGVYPTDKLPKSAAKSQLVGFALIAAAAFVQMS